MKHTNQLRTIKIASAILFITLFFAFIIADGTATTYIKHFSKNATQAFGSVEIAESLTAKVIKNIELVKNSNQCDGSSCYFDVIINHTQYGVLFDSLDFYTLVNGNRILQHIRSGEFFLRTKHELVDVVLDETTCKIIGQQINGSDIIQCTTKKVTEKAYNDEFSRFEASKKQDAGVYYVRYAGEKKPSRAVDWILKIFGLPLNEFAVWNSTTSYTAKNNQSLGGSTSSADKTGMIFQPYADGTSITRATRKNGVTCDNAQLWDYDLSISAGINVQNSTFTNDNATFNYPLVKDRNYSIVCDNVAHNAFNRYYDRPANPSYPYSTFYIKWVAGWDESSGTFQHGLTATGGDAINFISIDVSFLTGGNVSINSPANNTISSSSNFDINCSAAQVGATLVNMSLRENSTGVLTINQTNNITGYLNSTIFSVAFSDGEHIYSCYACDSDDDCYSNENRTLTYISPMNIDIISPKGAYTGSLTPSIIVNVTPSSLSNFSACYYNITRGASVEVSNVLMNMSQMPMLDNQTVSSYAVYGFNVFCNNSYGMNYTNSSAFTLSAAAAGGGSSGGGGGTTIIEKLINQTKALICDARFPPLNVAWKNYLAEKTFANFKIVWFAYWDYTLCKDAASFVPIE